MRLRYVAWVGVVTWSLSAMPAGATPVEIGTDQDGVFYSFDRDSVTTGADGLRSGQLVSSHPDDEYETIDRTAEIFSVDCEKQQLKLINTFVVYVNPLNGKQDIKSKPTPATEEWFPVEANTIEQSLLAGVCS